LDQLVSVGGMDSMLTTIWLIICAMGFGAVMEFAGMLERINQSIMRLAQTTARLIVTTISTGIGLNMIAGDDYLAIVLPGRMYKAEYAHRGLAPWNLSRAIKDAGATTSALVPWNTAGAFMAGTLGVATLTYLPYSIFNLAIPLISIGLGVTGFRIDRLPGHTSVSPERATEGGEAA
jgi:NhaC family Na+:H+ antiporter